MDIVFPASPDHLVRPESGLNLTDMGFAQIKQTQTRLTDATADG
jgi:hypothetical protein